MAITRNESGSVTIEGPHVEVYRLAVLKQALKLQKVGIVARRGVNPRKMVAELLGVSSRMEYDPLLQLLEEYIAAEKVKAATIDATTVNTDPLAKA